MACEVDTLTHQMMVDMGPCLFELDRDFPMSGSAADGTVLLDGWHEAEPWGR